MDSKAVAIIATPPRNALEVLAGQVDGIYAANLLADAVSSRGTRSAATERALKGDVLLFSAWCSDEGFAHMPATAETVAAFIDAQAAAGKAPASIRRYAASIAAYHRSAQAPNPLLLKIATDALKRMARARDEKQRQAKGINDDIAVKMLDARGTRNPLADLRNKALVAVAYTTLCRRGELVRLLAEDVQSDADQFGRVLVRKGKTDQTGKGAYVAITADAMHHLLAWLGAARIERGPLFRSVNRHRQVGGALDAGSVSTILKAMARRANLKPDEVARISGHSTRVGACQDMIRYGGDIAGAMQAGRWKTTTMVSRYCEGLELKRGAVAQVAARRRQFV